MLALIESVSAKLRIFRAPEFMAMAFLLAVLGLLVHLLLGANTVHKSHLDVQLLNVLAAGMLLISFAMLSARRTQRLIILFAWQGAILFLSTFLVAHEAGLNELYYSAALTLILKVIALPLILHTLIKRLGAQWDNERLVNIPTTMLVGLVLVIFAFGLAQPISLLATTVTRHTIGIALASFCSPS